MSCSLRQRPFSCGSYLQPAQVFHLTSKWGNSAEKQTLVCTTAECAPLLDGCSNIDNLIDLQYEFANQLAPIPALQRQELMLCCGKPEMSQAAGQEACTAGISSLAHLHTGREAACTSGVHVCNKKQLPCKKLLLLLGHCVEFKIPPTQVIQALLHPIMPACRVSTGRKPVLG